MFNNILEKIELKILKIITNKKRSLAWYILFLISRLYETLVIFRYNLYKKEVFKKRHSIGNLVISIGNITCGGTGKTPVTEILAKTLIKQGRKVVILSRGYKRKKIDNNPIIISDGEKILIDNYEITGDEPLMLAKNIPEAIVISNRNRIKSGTLAIQKYGVDTIILDDGFQYLALKSHINILLIDTTNPFDNHYVLPCGLLREPIKNIRRANYIFLTKSNGQSSLKHLKRFIKRHNHGAQIIECTHEEKFLCTVYSKEIKKMDFLKNKKVAIFCGIARPDSFYQMVNKYCDQIVYKQYFSDHHKYSVKEIKNFIKNSKLNDAQVIITTEKDAIRFDHRTIEEDIFSPFLFLYLRIEIKFLDGEDFFHQCIKQICWL